MTAARQNQQVSDVLHLQKEYFASGQTRSLQARDSNLQLLEQALVANKKGVLEALQQDLNKPNLEAYLAEYYFLLQEILLVRKRLKKWLKPKRVGSPVYMQPCRSEVHREPFGAVLIIAPWNYPIQLALAPLISAIAAGNTVVLKPSEHATASEQFLVNLLESTFPTGLVAVQTGGVETSEALLREKFDFIFFTGSTQVGKIVAKRAAENLTPCVLELGGKCPCIVDQSADLKLAASRLLNGKFFNGGQTCFAPDFVAVHESVRDAFITALKDELDAVPWSAEMASVVNQQHYQRLTQMLEGVAEADIFTSGEDQAERNFMAPRIVTNVARSDQLLVEEVFGPILPVVSFDSTDDLLAMLAGFGDPLAMYLFSENDNFCHSVTAAKRSGGVCINDTMKQSMSLELPFGGVGDSGYGRYRGMYGVEAFSYQRAVVKRGKFASKWLDLKPPYAKLFPWIEKFMR